MTVAKNRTAPAPAPIKAPVPPPPVRNAWTALLEDSELNTDDEPPPVVEAVSVAPDAEDEGSEAKLAVLLANPWDGVTSPYRYMMSEKLDGVRAYWDGTNFRSRLDNVFAVPDWYKDGMPKEHLDGEFWMERGKFQETSGLVRRQDKSDLWRKIRYMVFDGPNLGGGFESRYLALGTLLSSSSSNAERHHHRQCLGLDDLKAELFKVEEAGGEGLMLREPGSLYVRGRSNSLLKVKTFFDSEAICIGTTAGKGKHRGKIGALKVRIPETVNLQIGQKKCTLVRGIEFEVGTGLSDVERASQGQFGKTITFRFQELTNKGVPRFPSFLGYRNFE
jgi:DNA ligase-1